MQKHKLALMSKFASFTDAKRQNSVANLVQSYDGDDLSSASCYDEVNTGTMLFTWPMTPQGCARTSWAACGERRDDVTPHCGLSRAKLTFFFPFFNFFQIQLKFV